MTRLRDELNFEWDEAKAAANVAKHGIGFELARRLFRVSDCVEFEVSRPADGEMRFKRVGPLDGSILTVVFTLRLGALRLISARRANGVEEKRYADRAKPA